jgi:manganese transport protein
MSHRAIFLIGGCFAFELIVSHPVVAEALAGLIPSPQVITNPAALYIAIGILGATVMPHNLYLHSSIVQTRAFERNERGMRMAIKFGTLDSTASLLFAFFINAAILILSAAAFHGTGHQDVADIGDAYYLLARCWASACGRIPPPRARSIEPDPSPARWRMIVMEGFLNIRLRPWVRRLITRLIATCRRAGDLRRSGWQATHSDQ